MATQAIRFLGPSGLTLTLDVFTLASDTAEQTALACTEATNRKGLYVTANFTDTLAGRHLIVKKNVGLTIGNEFVDLVNADGTYDAESITASPSASEADLIQAIKDDPELGTTGLLLDAKQARQFDTNRRLRDVISTTQWRYTVYDDDGVTFGFRMDFNPLTGEKAIVP